MENKEYMIGRTKVIINYSYVNSRTPEQEKLDDQMLSEAVWLMCEPDDVEEAG